MMNELVAIVLTLWAALCAIVGMATVQTDLFGGRVVTGEQEKNEVEWVKLHELLAKSKGAIRRKISGWAINLEKGCISIFFSNSTAAVLYLKPLPELLEKWPSMKGDGERFVEAVVRLTGDTIQTDADLEAALDGVAPKEMTLHLEYKTTQGKTKTTYTAWRLSAKHPN